jgi:hypothetical protein
MIFLNLVVRGAVNLSRLRYLLVLLQIPAMGATSRQQRGRIEFPTANHTLKFWLA